MPMKNENRAGSRGDLKMSFLLLIDTMSLEDYNPKVSFEHYIGISILALDLLRLSHFHSS